jgi:hypothetical protein
MSYIGNSPGVASQRVETAFTATSNQTAFTPSSGYTLGYCDVYQNGVKLVNGDDYTASDGATVTLATGAASGDSIVIVASFPRGLTDGYLKSEADAKYVALTGAQTVAGVKTFSSQIVGIAGTAGAPAVTTTGDLDTGIFFPAANTLAFSTNGTEDARFDSAGNFGIGTTSPAVRLHLTGDNPFIRFDDNAGGSQQDYEVGSESALFKIKNVGQATEPLVIDNSGNVGIGASSPSARLDVQTAAQVIGNLSSSNAAGGYFTVGRTGAQSIIGSYSAASGGGTAVNADALFIRSANGIGFGPAGGSVGAFMDANGSLLIGDTTQAYNNQGYMLSAKSSGNQCILSLAKSGQTLGSGGIIFGVDSSTGFLWVRENQPLLFGTNNADRGRIAANGFTHFTSDGQYYNASSNWHSMETATSDNPCIFLNRHGSAPYGPFIYFTGASPNNTSMYFLAGSDTTNQKFVIYSNGTFGSRTSTYGGISDIKVKQDIVDAGSQWSDIKSLRFRKYRFKDDPTGPLQLGLISQEAELVSPGLVFATPDTERGEDGNMVETGEVTKSVKYSILYMKAVVALQEAMNRIEQLEADVATLKGQS